jgi:hypothetical protein
MAPVFYRATKLSTPRQQVNNLSLQGVRIYSDERLDMGQTLELEFFFPNGIIVEVMARVVWIKKQPPGSAGVYDVGMEFINLSEKALKELDAVLKKN